MIAHHATALQVDAVAVDAVVADVVRLAQLRGARLTPGREAVLRALLASPRPLTAYQLLDVLQGQAGHTTPVTIYRALAFLTEERFAHRISSLKAFVADRSPARQCRAPLFLICDDCGDVALIDDRRASRTIEDIARATGFDPAQPIVEAHGFCHRCQRAAGARLLVPFAGGSSAP